MGSFALALGGVYLYHAFIAGPKNASQASRSTASQYLPGSICQNFYQSICKRKGLITDPTGTVHTDIADEKAVLALYQEIIHENPEWSSDQVDDELVGKIYTVERRQKFEETFGWVQDAIERLIESQPSAIFTTQEKSQLIHRVKKTQLELPPPANIYADEPDLLTKTDVFYERVMGGTRRLRVGGAFFYSPKSVFNLIFTIAHELAHSIDPCEARSARLSFPSYDRIKGCFLRDGVIATRKTRSECGKNDQLSEIFADWIAVQITVDAIAILGAQFTAEQKLNAAMNSVRDLCDEEDSSVELDFEFHPRPEVRINQIFGMNPAIRNIVGCQPVVGAPPYCSFESTAL